MKNCARINFTLTNGAVSVGRYTVLFPLVFILMLAAISPVYGGGGREQALIRADQLIQDREFEEAILILTDFSRNNPDRFDLAQERIRRIYRIRDEFNRTADELIETLLNDPNNDEKLLELTKKLYSLEHEDSPLLANFIYRTRGLSEFNVNRNLLRRILERGAEALERGDSAAAIQIYAGGMSFMRDEFFASGYGETIEREVTAETERINAMLASFVQANSRMMSLSANLTLAINSGDMPRITQSISAFMPAINRFIELKNDLYAASGVFERILDRLQMDDPNLRDRSHLAFLSVLINGRGGRQIQEGMLGAFDAAWRNSVNSSLTALSSYIGNANTSALAAFNAGEYAASAAALDRMESYYSLSWQFFDRHRLFFRGEQARTIALFGNNILQLDIRVFLELMALNEANNSLRQASFAAMRQNIDRSSLIRWQEGLITAASALASEQQTRNNIGNTRSEIENILSRSREIDSAVNSHAQIIHITNAVAAIEKFHAIIASEEQQSVLRYYTIAHNNLQNSITLRLDEMERGKKLLEGESRVSEDGVVTILRYPTEALEVFAGMLGALTADLGSANTVMNQYRREPQAITANEQISNLNVNHQMTINELEGLRSQVTALAETARSRSTQAEARRQEGERLFRDGQTAFQRQDFDTARDRIQRSSDMINSSLEIQASAALRSLWDSRLINFGLSISGAENELIIAEVRGLVTNARVAYFAGNFQQAEENLVRARNRWRVTNPDENEEVVYWLGIVRAALSVRSGRVIPATAPLFAEMSQLLSQARRSYEEGVRLINTGQRTSGLAKFSEARQMTREVRLIFPVNQEAGILELRIEQFTDPMAFNASFEQRIRNAIAGTRQRSLESFADLQNLAEINPGYPNIRAIITQAEIDMGFRPPPPNPANIARSNELTTSVNRILEGNIASLYAAALAQIDEAIALNPENTEAMRAKDRLLTRISIPGSIVLSSEDEEIYQRALREFQSGNNLIARALVENLLANPRNRNITKLVELQRRIQAIL